MMNIQGKSQVRSALEARAGRVGLERREAGDGLGSPAPTPGPLLGLLALLQLVQNLLGVLQPQILVVVVVYLQTSIEWDL